MNETKIVNRKREYVEPNPGYMRAFNDARDEYRKVMGVRADFIKRESKPLGGDSIAGMTFDYKFAPMVSGRLQLLRCGIIPVPPHELTTSDDLHDELWTVIEGLAECGVFLMNTNHLSDADLYARLYYKILEERVHILPSDCAAEYIDCFHELDTHHPIGKAMAEVKAERPVLDRTAPAARGPICAPAFKHGPLYGRDLFLPVPANLSDGDSVEVRDEE